MKTLKITLALLAVMLLTVSGVQSDRVSVNDEDNTSVQKPTNIDLLAHRKAKLKIITKG